MNIRINTSGHSGRDELTEVETEPFDYGANVRCFKICSCSMIIENSLDNQSTPIRRNIEWNPTHWTGRVRSGTTRFPAIQASLVKLVAAPNLPSGTLTPHG